MHYYKGEHEITFFLFTDTDPTPYLPNLQNIIFIKTNHSNWVDGTNSKFSNILYLNDKKYDTCDYYFYFDADTDINKPFTEKWFIGDLVGGEHYNNRWVDKEGKMLNKPYDRNEKSRAYIPHDTPLPQTYYYGAFFGGKRDRIMEFCRINLENQKADKLIGYEPCCNDESYINRYFHHNPPTLMVPNNVFAFIISDKGGIGETRNMRLNIDVYKRRILDDPTRLFTIQNGEFIFHYI
jgi:hypothetical protein